KFENFNTNKNLLLPLSFNMSLSNIYLSDISDTVKVNDIAKYIFEDKLDFTSSMIQSDGLYFYSYNNGNEILKISKSGILEYKKELSETSKDDIKKSTNAMLNFLIKLGINNNDIIIDKVEKINHSSNIIYKFNIKRQKNGIYIYMLENGESENISVSGDTVISANILLKNIGDYTGSSYDIIEPTKAINDKIEYIKNKLNEKDVSTIISKIDDISLVYKKESEIIVPMWLYVIDDFVFFIDAVNIVLIISILKQNEKYRQNFTKKNLNNIKTILSEKNISYDFEINTKTSNMYPIVIHYAKPDDAVYKKIRQNYSNSIKIIDNIYVDLEIKKNISNYNEFLEFCN
ncbi:MAG: hypothetical protein HXL16_06950, partial [Peptostreptococcaceae bacterium]|nr:hypothetical protein [Peptostreptococcaceae bacterium]